MSEPVYRPVSVPERRPRKSTRRIEIVRHPAGMVWRPDPGERVEAFIWSHWRLIFWVAAGAFAAWLIWRLDVVLARVAP